MQPHQQRVVDEKTELEGKLQLLTTFLSGDLFTSLPEDEQKRLNLQAGIMADYVEVLEERITAF
tara:strand:+ start:398 stop:589 length:192 start_codon:yes stop_codon:yes gene_type:complete